MASALVLGAGSAARDCAQAALERAGWALVGGGEALAWGRQGYPARALEALAASAPPHLVVCVAGAAGDGALRVLSPERLRELEADVLVAPWEALRESARVLAAPGSAVLLVAGVAGPPAADRVFAAAAQRALRTMIAAAAVEFATRESPLRVNLLEYDEQAFDARAFGRALAFLASPDSGFMTGSHLALPGPGAAISGSAT
jgi:hypothetical protein